MKLYFKMIKVLLELTLPAGELTKSYWIELASFFQWKVLWVRYFRCIQNLFFFCHLCSLVRTPVTYNVTTYLAVLLFPSFYFCSFSVRPMVYNVAQACIHFAVLVFGFISCKGNIIWTRVPDYCENGPQTVESRPSVVSGKRHATQGEVEMQTRNTLFLQLHYGIHNSRSVRPNKAIIFSYFQQQQRKKLRKNRNKERNL